MSKGKKGKLLIVDDVDINRIILREILEDTYEIEEAADGMEAVEKMISDNYLPTAVLLDIMMPEMDGYEVLKFMKSNPDTYDIPVIFITAADADINESKGLSLGANEYIVKPFNHQVVKLRVNNQVELRLYREKLEATVDKKVNELVSLRDTMLETLASIIEYRNMESGLHVKRTSHLTKMFIEHLMKKPEFFQELNEANPRVVVKAVPLHDIGKIGIPDYVLLKPGRLTDDEFEIIKSHTTIGSEIIDNLLLKEDELYLRHCRDICRFHHERWDGRGYPDKLEGKNIPLSARIVSIVDVYDALTSHRVYKNAFSHEEAMDIIKNGAGTQFDADLVAAFVEIEKEVKDLDVTLHETL